MRGVLALAFVTLALAGCTDSATDRVPDEVEQKLDQLDTKATADTGVIRGIVLDQAITPVEAALVEVLGTPESTLTDSDGIFAFEGIPPGTYFLKVSRDGFNTTQTSTVVVAGIDKPDIVKVQLNRDPKSGPYVQPYQFDGIIQCSIRASIVGYPLCSALGVDEDFEVYYSPDRVPHWVQAEMTWRSSQLLGDEMSLSITCLNDPACPDGQVVLARHEGPSPLTIMVNHTTADTYNIGKGNDIWMRHFVHWLPESDPPEDTVYETAGIDCIEWNGVLGLTGCIRFGGIGFAADQSFTTFTHIFYGYEPPVDWRFLTDGPPPQP